MESNQGIRSTYIPLHQDLINHVKRLDGSNDEEIGQLKYMLYSLVRQNLVMSPRLQLQVQGGKIDQKQLESHDELLQITLKLHQVLALLDIDLQKMEQEPEHQLKQILDQLSKNGGLNYVPRERTPQGRMFEHASDCRVLLQHLKLVQAQPKRQSSKDLEISKVASKDNKGTDDKKDIENLKEVMLVQYYIRLDQQEAPKQMSKEMSEQSLSSFQTTDIEDGNIDHNEQKEPILVVMKEFIDLTLQANGKADLYFHAYFWQQLILTLYLKANPKAEEQDFEKAHKSLEFARLKGLAESLKKVHANLAKFPYNKEIYEKHVNDFGGRKQVRKMKLLEEIQRALFVAQISDDQDTLYWIEKILIQLLGFYEISVRDQAVVLLNMLYDGIDWQLTSPFRPVIRVVGQHFKVNVIVDIDIQKDKGFQIFIGLSAPSPIEGNNKVILSWHRIEQRNIVKQQGRETEISINFGKFWKCGFYDWRLVVVQDNGRLQPLDMVGKPEPLFPSMKQQDNYYEEDDTIGSLAQGRFIVHAKGMRDHIFHEVSVDYQNAEVDHKERKFIKRGDFQKVEKAIDSYKKRGITALYLMGALERDNYPFLNRMTNEIEFRKFDASPLAITCRKAANKMLGGEEGFQRVMSQAKKSKMKIIIDCLSRISSSRSHRQYRDLMLNYLDEEGRKNICYGTDGQAMKFEDTALLNYRKVESWNLLIDEVLEFTQKHGINGIHLDNGQAWPQIMEPDLEELMRIDVDGEPAYTAFDVMNGEIVIRNENYGYWNTNTMESYPNPFFIKMCKKVWEKIPDFIFIGECWGGFMFENRQIILSRSGIIPRLYKLPQAISTLFGKKLFKDGRVEACPRDNVLALKKWYESNRQFLPESSILIQSSSAHQWPYPAYLYGKGTWAAVDILYFMPDIPITFMGEIDGEVYRLGTTQVFQHEPTAPKTSSLKKSNSQLMMALTQQQDQEEQKSAKKSSGTPENKKGLVRVRSGSNFAALLIEQTPDVKAKEEMFKAQIGPQHGFDLTKISSHYEHRRRLRREKMVLRYGELVPLVARHDNGWHHHVLAFGRYSLMETAIIAINLNEHEVSFYVDLSPLINMYTQKYSQNTVVMISNLLQPDTQPEYYFLKEFLNMKQVQKLNPFHSSVQSITICQDDEFVMKKTLTQSVERTKIKLQKGENIESEQVSLVYSEIIENSPYDVIRFANIIGSLQESFLSKLNLSFNDLFVHNNKLKNDATLASRLIALCTRIVENCDEIVIPPQIAAKSVVDNNKIGPIVFCTPELGRWSTVGGLGVMVDELAYGLAQLGQEVWVISPYYERNRKGETGYLAKDPAGITYKENLSVSIGSGFTLGVHEGVVHGVKVVFLHNSEVFPTPYSDSGAFDQVKQMAIFGKGCLQFCCNRKIIPAVCVTNDWFTGLIPGYAKVGAFGDTFKGTTFFHIVHNLEPTYEGRLYPSPHEGALEGLHQLPKDWLIDPWWGKLVINPSRCALMLCDQWGTVSPSYKEDLLRTSPLAGLLKQKPQAFAFPNGIPVKSRLKRLDEAAPNHLEAKKIIQKKYFGFGELDDDVCLLSFVGRITSQKGVHLILDAAEYLIQKTQYKINILIGGAANMREPYSAGCAHKMWRLREKYPNCFWADPQMFFTDGSLVNRGSDYGLMPSAFEPGGIVQHEFFVGGTPVIAFKTGGLKDSVFEFMWDTEEGNGYCFESHNHNDFVYACERALGTFKNKAKYQKLRENAFKSVMDGEKVSRAWLLEFYRLKEKVYFDETIMKDCFLKMKPWAPEVYKPMHSFEELFGVQHNINFALEDIDFGAEEVKEVFEEEKTHPSKKILSQFENPSKDDKLPHVFLMHNNGPRYQKVELCGSFDNWQKRHEMSFDNFTNQWFITLHLGKGKFFYKYVVNGSNWVINEKEPKEKDVQGNLNNILVL